MVRTLASTLMALVVSALPVAVAAVAGGPTYSMQSSLTSVAVNGQFTVTVQLDTKTYQVSGTEVSLTFPSDKLQAVSIVPGTLLPNKLGQSSVGSSAVISVGSGDSPKTGTGSVAIVTFKAIATGQAAIGFSDATNTAAVGQSNDVTDTMTGVSVTITTASAAATQTPAATRTPASSGAVGAVSQVSTGPLESTVVALVVAATCTLLYVGYVGTDTFRRREAEGLSKTEREHAPDFRGPGSVQ